MGLYGAICGYMGLINYYIWVIWGYMGLYGGIYAIEVLHMDGLYGAKIHGLYGAIRAIWAILAIWAIRAIWALWAIWDYMGLDGAIWGYMGLDGARWAIWAIWG